MVAIQGETRTLRVGKILCLGRNYAKHVREMHAPLPESPVVFLKPATALLGAGGVIRLPHISRNLHHEAELVIAIGRGGRNIPAAEADKHILGYAIGLDMTLRDLQDAAKKGGLPWSVAKGFDTSAPVSPIVLKERFPDPASVTILCRVNGKERQRGSTADMIYPIPEIIAYVSSIFTLEEGDLIFTGTPEGVGQVCPGDTVEAEIEGVVVIRHSVGEAV